MSPLVVGRTGSSGIVERADAEDLAFGGRPRLRWVAGVLDVDTDAVAEVGGSQGMELGLGFGGRPRLATAPDVPDSVTGADSDFSFRGRPRSRGCAGEGNF